MFFITFLGGLYLFIGLFCLVMPLIYIEIGRPKDLIKAGLIILLGIFLIIKQNTFNYSQTVILSLNFVLLTVFIIEVFINRWNQLLSNEKIKFKSFSEIRKNLQIFLNIIKGGFQDINSKFGLQKIFQKKLKQKKWIRTPENVNIEISNNNQLNISKMDTESTNFSQEDIMRSDKNQTKSSKIDKQ